MYPKNLKDIQHPAVRSRVAIERRIVRSLVEEFIGQGFSVSVDDGEETFPRTVDVKQAMNQLLNTDEDRLSVFNGPKGGKYLGTIMLVYGNGGYDVMSDWHTSLDKYMPKTLALVEKLS